MSKPKFVKPILIGVACTIPVGLVVGLSVNWDRTQFISAVGSSGVKPFIEKFGKKYHEEYSNFDVTVESGGTTFAVEQLVKGYTNLGNASNNPYPNINAQGFMDQWDNKKTLTLGWEGLVLLYSLPKNLSDEAKANFEIVINKDNILPLYGIFAGYHELKNGNWDNQYENLWYYHDPECESLISDDDKDILMGTKILPFVRSGGNTGANSSIAFTMYSNLADFNTDLTENQQKAFRGGQYGKDNDHEETDESNSRAWQSLVAEDVPGSMVYLTTSFLTSESNIKEIKDHGCKLAKYKASDDKLIDYDPTSFDLDNVRDSLDKLCVTGKYNWYRPINVMLDINEKKCKDFLWWIYFGNTEGTPTKFSDQYKEFVYALGSKPINFEEHLISMCIDKDVSKLFDVLSTDIELAKTRPPLFTQVYGAEDIWES